MRSLPLLGAMLLALSASAREKGDGPNGREPKKEATPLERACRERTVRLTLAEPAPPEPGAEPAAPLPPLKEEAHEAAAELGGRIQYWHDDQGQRTLRWKKGKKTPEECQAALLAMGARLKGRLLVTDPRYGRNRELIKVGADTATAEVTKVEKALPKAEIRSSPGFFEKFFDGGTSPLAANQAPGFGGVPGQAADSSGDPSSPQAFWAAERQRAAAQSGDWRYGTAFPSTFNRDSAAPPMPGSVSFPEPWYRAPVRELARTADRGVAAVRSAGSYVYEGASKFAGQAWEWAKENLMRAPLAQFSRISSTFGSRLHPIKKTWRHHTGVDYAAAYGTAVMAAGEGKVVSAGWKGGYGNAIVIRHASGTETLYGHLSSYGVRAGQTVTAGRVIGRVGSTGQSTGPHLHYEVRRGGTPVDPLKVASL